MAWAFARLGKPNPDFLHLLREQADADMSRFPERLLPDLAWSLVKLEAAEDDTMQKLADEAQQVTRLDGVSWMTLILSLNHANVKPRQIDKLVRNCAASLKGKIKSQTESSLLALHWLLRSVKRTKGIASFRKDIDIEISNRGLDSLDLSTMFTQEGAFLQLLPSESATFAAT
ncbi:SAMHD1 [Symbiodinium pilosum]|uniref:SAMHD1 protein n=1 Tax=Symbiodinium pilosum TaxID=2952 RepID=A0A812UBV2_SYMPI|nr:SAMHD1 [Symbiodinium pilosum]